jgi:hypothetical protein
MALRLSPSHPLVWRTSDEVQFGVEHPLLRLRGLDTEQHFLLGLLQKGVSRPVLCALASSRGIAPLSVDALLASVTPALERSPPPRSGVLDGVTVEVRGHGVPVPSITALLRRCGAVAAVPGVAPAFGVLVSHYATAPRRASAWLTDDVPHLLVEFGDRSVRIGPMVVGGTSACAACLEFARAETDPCWPALASQLAGRQALTADAVGASIAAGLVVDALREHRSLVARGSPSPWPGRALRVRPSALLDPDGVSVESVSPHPRCGCRSLPGSATPSAPLHDGSPPPPRRAAVVPGRG